MRYSNYIGVIAALLLITGCFLPWVYIASIKTTITGVNTFHTGLGKPGAVHIFFAFVATLFFLLPYTWAKRANVFVGALTIAWSFRNYLIVTQCQMGECPEKKMGIYAVVVCSIIVFIMSLLPRLSTRDVEEPGAA